jgi:hypothetical protein
MTRSRTLKAAALALVFLTGLACVAFLGSCRQPATTSPPPRTVVTPPSTFPLARPAAVRDDGKARYAKIVVNQDASKVLLVSFERSPEARGGYDLMRADTKFTGSLKNAEQIPGTLTASGTVFLAHFPIINLQVPFNQKGSGIPNPSSVQFRYYGSGSDPRVNVSLKMRLREGATYWDYSFRGMLKPSASPQTAPVLDLSRAAKPNIEITTQPDPAKKGYTGIGLQLGVADMEVDFRKGTMPSTAPSATIVFTGEGGRVAHRSTASLDKFTFG